MFDYSQDQKRLMLELETCYRQKKELEKILQNQNPVQGNTFNFSYYQINKKNKELSKDIDKINSALTPNIIA